MIRKIYKDKLKNRTWSFSSVNSYVNCPKGFFLNYIERVASVQNAFAEWGSFMHELLERYYKGKCEFFELSQMYEEEYSRNIKAEFPPNKYVDLNESYMDSGLDYLNSFEGLLDCYEVVGVEQKAKLTIGGYKFVGYIDLILRDKTDNKLIVYDHKSKSGFKNKKELSEYLRQLYLYSIYIYEVYGEYPKQLIFNMFRAGEKVVTDFNIDDLNDAKKWFIDTINIILADKHFYDKIRTEYKRKNKKLSEFKKDDFFCNNLCGSRNYCTRAKKYNRK